MTYKMYLLDIHDLEDKSLSEEAMALIDDKRREIANKYCKEKDRLRAIAAGLLLQLGFLELEPECLSELTRPVQIQYIKGTHGKPFWDRDVMEKEYPSKKYWHFNLSHSGDYVVLVIADREIGVDVQEFRDGVKYPGGIQEFCRTEAYVKCTGEGFAHGRKEYDKYHGNVPGYEFVSIETLENYALFICFAEDKLCKG